MRKQNQHTYAARNLGLGQEPLDGEELLSGDVDLVALLEGARDHALAHLDGEVNLVDRAKDLIHTANDRLVLEVDGCIEVRYLVGHEGLAEHFIFNSMHEGAHLCKAKCLEVLAEGRR